MENRIRLLPEIVANQIAAGEVVNNPSSVVKEMMENAIDAGATSVTVNYRNAGLELIQIVDNGCGMSPLDARMAFDRHATSKITKLDDVYRLHTFGFRGEALASIAAVSQVELRTRRAEDEIGTVTVVNGGEFISQTLNTSIVKVDGVNAFLLECPISEKMLELTGELLRQLRDEKQAANAPRTSSRSNPPTARRMSIRISRRSK